MGDGDAGRDLRDLRAGLPPWRHRRVRRSAAAGAVTRATSVVAASPPPPAPSREGRGGRPLYSAAAATTSPSCTPRTAYSAATLIASIMLTALARPVPAMSNAVP